MEIGQENFEDQYYQYLNFKAELRNEAMYHVNKKQIMTESLSFNDLKINDENSRIILVKLIFLLNQGVRFSDYEVEQLFFRITKSLQSSNVKLRQMTYKSLKVNKYSNIQVDYAIEILAHNTTSVSNDLVSSSELIKIQALKFIPYIENESYIHSIERFIHNALANKNFMMKSTALQVGIQIVNKFPNFLRNWLFDVVKLLDQEKENIQYHALILLHEIKKSNIAQFIKFITVLSEKKINPLTQTQLIRFIQVIIPTLGIREKQFLLKYLLQQQSNQDLAVFLQSASILLRDQEIQNTQVQTAIDRLTNILSIYDTSLYLQKFIALGLIEKFIFITERKKVIKNQILPFIQAYTLSFSTSLAQRSLYICVILYENQALNYIKIMFNYPNLITLTRCDLLKGLLEFIIDHPQYGLFALNFIQQIMFENSDSAILITIIQILEQIIINQSQLIQVAFETLCNICQRNIDLPTQFQVIRLISRCFFGILIEKYGCSQISFCYQFLKQNVLNEISDFSQVSDEKYKLIQKEIIKFLDERYFKIIPINKKYIMN